MTAAPHRAVLLLGPTGAGKTALSLSLARRFHGGVVNIDSRQVYAGFPIITAQPSPEEQTACPHLLFGHLDCRQKITAGSFLRQCHEAVDQLAQQGRLPLLVGGTGLYARALVEGLAPVPDVPPEVAAALQDQLQVSGLPALRRRLEAADPLAAARIHPNDTQRTLRALEVYEATGRPLSWWQQRPHEGAGRIEPLKLGVLVEREELEGLLARRIELMMQAGALEEARAAWEACPDPEAPAWSGIGCAELLAHLRGELGLEEARALWLRNTRAYAKRQMTWFRKDPEMHWLRPDAAGTTQALELVGEFLEREGKPAPGRGAGPEPDAPGA